jgi:hypothetical protein
MIYVTKAHVRKSRSNDKQRAQIIVDGPSPPQAKAKAKAKAKPNGTSSEGNSTRAPSYKVHHDDGFKRSPEDIATTVAYLLFGGLYPFANRVDSVSVMRIPNRFVD